MFGLLNVDKPSGVSSRDAVNAVQELVRPVKVGHAGTLDPLARGVLVLCLGPATRLVPYVQQMPKQYRATFLLGRRSDSDDVEGEVVELPGAPQPARGEIEAVLPRFVGEIQQRPPAYSALKVSGRRAYKLARAGRQVQLAERPVTVYELAVVSWEYPQLVLDVRCGSGTYVRSLGRDVAAALDTAAVMSALVRTAVGDFRLEDACPLAELTAESLAERLLSPRLAVAQLPSLEVTAAELARLAHGRAITRREHGLPSEVAAVDSGGELVALLTPRGPHELRPTRNFASRPR